MSQETNVATGVAGRYASALFDLARERAKTDEVMAGLDAFDRLLAESADLRRMAASPALSAAEQGRAVAVVLQRAGVFGLAADFVKLVARKRRLAAVGGMIAAYRRLDDRAKGVVRAEVTAASPLSDSHVAALKAALAGAGGGKSVDLAVKVDPAIVGGLVVKLGSRMVDGSIRTRLNALRARMKEVG
ncbi:MAG: F0F1 ATP synthase subunit delta [Hyphomicrobiales bacterium]|nr:F0F1 ATP synthase subunit delta [Hyphomicrobiales bacterium]MDE2017610.1 F0F1 ATP synthase subunit delta [Hyphomicrobiales bacterium]